MFKPKNIIMKNLLLILPLSLAMTVAMGQGNDRDMKSPSTTPTTSLDGKSFKITLTTKNTMDDKSGSIQGSGTSTGVTGTTETGTVDGTATTKTGTTTRTTGTTGAVETTSPATPAPADKTNTAQNATGYDKNSDLTNKKMVIRFENGTLQCSMLAANGINNCPYTVNSHAGNMITFSANCRNSATGMSGTEKTGTTRTTETGTTLDKSSAGTNDNPVTGTATTRTSETTTTTTADAGGKAMWSGTVDGNNIRGNYTWTTPDGKSVYYTFTGTKATQKDIDDAQELGSR
jgi:hypothetical protein